VFDYRERIDTAVNELLSRDDDPELAELIELGLQHEQQHQELLLTDIKHALSCNPLLPAYQDRKAALPPASASLMPLRFISGKEGIR
jgi:hypothetical protein